MQRKQRTLTSYVLGLRFSKRQRDQPLRRIAQLVGSRSPANPATASSGKSGGRCMPT